MTVRALAGLAILNLAILGAGASVLWGVRGWRWWTEFLRFIGVAYLVGVASLTVLLTLEIVLGIPFGPATFLVSATAIAVGGVLAGVLRGRSRPGFRPPGWRLGPPSLVAAAFAAAIGLFAGFWFRWLAAAAAFGLVLLMIGAAILRARVDDERRNIMADLTLALCAAVTGVVQVLTI